jgi:putative endonuclease
MPSSKKWFAYILECGDGTLYTGVTNDLDRRVRRHNAGTGARYTRARLPVRLVYREPCADRAAAQRRERAIKAMPRNLKLALISGAD